MISGTNVATVTPTIAEMTWPPTKFRVGLEALNHAVN
jgi:hypothetical protein